MRIRRVLVSWSGPVLLAIATPAIVGAEIRRTADGRPDLSGTYDGSTLTPLERPPEFGDLLYLTPEEAARMVEEERALMARGDARTTGDRQAPPVGGAAVVGFEDRREEGELFGAGNVGAYNTFWFDRGDSVVMIDGKFRTSILTDPPDGRLPPMHPVPGAEYERKFASLLRNDGTAWWLAEAGPGPYDDMETRPLAERCLVGFVEGPPMEPGLYNNFVRVVQTSEHVVILNEMIHDARIVRMEAEHVDPAIRRWLGDSVGHWEGDTLVIETQNFRDETGVHYLGASRHMKVTERLTPLAGGDLQYAFTVDDPTVWTATWSGDFVWARTEGRIFEYACHEGNYALGNVMRGARLLEENAGGKRREGLAQGP
jgi:hypothetical protein